MSLLLLLTFVSCALGLRMLVDSGELPLGEQVVDDTLEQVAVDQSGAEFEYFEDTGDQS